MTELVKKTVYDILYDYLDNSVMSVDTPEQEMTILCLMRKAQAEIHKRYQWNNNKIILGTNEFGNKVYIYVDRPIETKTYLEAQHSILHKSYCTSERCYCGYEISWTLDELMDEELYDKLAKDYHKLFKME